MNTKLTLSINKNVVTEIKRYAREKGVSVSRLTEAYFNELANKKKNLNSAPSVDKLKGLFGKNIKDFDWKQGKYEILKQKRGL